MGQIDSPSTFFFFMRHIEDSDFFVPIEGDVDKLFVVGDCKGADVVVFVDFEVERADQVARLCVNGLSGFKVH